MLRKRSHKGCLDFQRLHQIDVKKRFPFSLFVQTYKNPIIGTMTLKKQLPFRKVSLIILA